jgi:hypothetical protein
MVSNGYINRYAYSLYLDDINDKHWLCTFLVASTPLNTQETLSAYLSNPCAVLFIRACRLHLHLSPSQTSRGFGR